MYCTISYTLTNTVAENKNIVLIELPVSYHLCHDASHKIISSQGIWEVQQCLDKSHRIPVKRTEHELRHVPQENISIFCLLIPMKD